MGAIKWMTSNHIAANILMAILLIGGFASLSVIKQEVFPEVDLGRVRISVDYPGAGPEEIESGVILPIEEAISSVDGIKKIKASAVEGSASIIAEAYEGEDVKELARDIEIEIDRITTFPDAIEKPIIAQVEPISHVLSLVVYGKIDERSLTEITEHTRDELLDLEEVNKVTVSAVRKQEISIEIEEETLKKFGLSLLDISEKIRRSSLDLPAGSVKTVGGEILVRTVEKKYVGYDYENVIVLAREDGSNVYLSEIATINDGFENDPNYAFLDGSPAAMIDVFRLGKQTPSTISAAIYKYINNKKPFLPPNVGYAVWNDSSEVLNDRINLLSRNAAFGLILVLLVLGLFLKLNLAFWVTMGIPISFLGAFLLLPALGASINMMSLFAFILTLGIVVDDAIVVGESIYRHKQMGKPAVTAAFDGTIEVIGPVVFAALTTITVFVPMLFMTGVLGEYFGVIPIIVISVLVISVLEGLFILPAHLSTESKSSSWSLLRFIDKVQTKFDLFLANFIKNHFLPFVKMAMSHRYNTLAFGVGLLLLTVGFVGGGYIKFITFPSVEGDIVKASLSLPLGIPVEQTEKHLKFIELKGRELLAKYDGLRSDDTSNLRNSFGLVGSQFNPNDIEGNGSNNGAHLAEISFFFNTSSVRNLSLLDFAKEWREAVGPIPGADSLKFSADAFQAGKPIEIEISHSDQNILVKVSNEIKEKLAKYNGVFEIQDDYSEGKPELQLTMKPEAASLGVSEQDIAQQIRAAFFGEEALRLQRGRNEVKVMIRYPEKDRKLRYSLENMRIITPQSGDFPLSQAAYIHEGISFGKIDRVDRKRVITITAEVDPALADSNEILASLQESVFPSYRVGIPGLKFNIEGQAKDFKDSAISLLKGLLIAQFVIYCILAVAFKSYSQPFLVLSAVPFGFFGAVVGHIVMGYDLSLLSLLGLLALSGVVVNDSLILVDYTNTKKREGASAYDAVILGIERRVRPILLTSLTTFFGVAPMILETSLQAQFLIPMAVSLGFGVLFATGIILVIVPVLYLIEEDILALCRRIKAVSP